MLLHLLLSIAFAQTTTVIQPIDLSQDGPTHANYCLLLFNVKALKNPNIHSHAIVRQLSNRVRFEFEGGDLPHGMYTLAVGANCDAKDYKSSWQEVHQFKVQSKHVATEHSVRDMVLHGKPPKTLDNQNLGFWRVNGGKYQLIDCKPIR